MLHLNGLDLGPQPVADSKRKLCVSHRYPLQVMEYDLFTVITSIALLLCLCPTRGAIGTKTIQFDCTTRDNCKNISIKLTGTQDNYKKLL